MKAYIMRVLLAFDLFLNTVLGGLPYETISGRVGKAARDGALWALIAQSLIDLLFFFDPHHCRKNILYDAHRARLLGQHLED